MAIIKYDGNNLTNKQLIVYKFVCEKINKDEPINFDEAKELYLQYGATNVQEGKAGSYYVTRQPDGTETTKFFPYLDFELKLYVSNFITRYIGILVLKGALKVVPQLQLN